MGLMVYDKMGEEARRNANAPATVCADNIIIRRLTNHCCTAPSWAYQVLNRPEIEIPRPVLSTLLSYILQHTQQQNIDQGLN